MITIIILLILAGISIGALTGSGLFQKAGDAKKSYKEAERKENLVLGEYENYIDNLEKNDNIINFTLDGVKYSCEKGTIWADFLFENVFGKGYCVAINSNGILAWASGFKGGATVMDEAYKVYYDSNEVNGFGEIKSGEYITSSESIYVIGTDWLRFN